MGVKFWTSSELETLKKINSQGMPIKEMTSLLNRSYNAIAKKISLLGLNFADTPVDLNELEEGILKVAKQKKRSLISLSNSFNVGPNTIKKAVTSLHGRGYVINIKDDTVAVGYHDDNPVIKIDTRKFFGGKPEKAYLLRDGKRIKTIEGFNYKFGAIADTHLGSKYERLDVLNALYDIFEKEGVKIVLHGGNYVDGEFRFNKFETKTHGFDEMIDYFLKNYPKRKGIKTLFISGDDHEGWWTQQTGIDPGRVIEERQKEYGRDDLVYLGYQEANIELKSSKGTALLKILHGGMGTSYADSYRTQKMVESFSEGEKPHILLVGHYHKAIYHTPRGVHTLLLGTTQGQTRFMRKKELKAYLGGWIVEINQSPTGEINRFKPEWIPFWGKKFYQEHITSHEVKELDELINET